MCRVEFSMGRVDPLPDLGVYKYVVKNKFQSFSKKK